MLTNRLSSVARVFFTYTPKALAPFLIGAMFLSVVGNAVYGLLTDLLGTTRWALIGITVGALLIFLLCLWLVTMVMTQMGRPLRAYTCTPEKHKGLILLVSRTEACEKAITSHRSILQQIWLLCSAKTLHIAEQIRDANADLVVNEPIVINDLNNPLEVKGWIEQIYAGLPSDWEESDLIADYTGMTAHCSVGVALACLSPTRHLQYTPAIFDANLNAVGSGEPIEVRLDWELTGLTPKLPQLKEVLEENAS